MDWNEAAKRYEDDEKAVERLKKMGIPANYKKSSSVMQREIEDVITGLEEFLKDKGESAKRLLAASGNHIIIVEENEGGAYGKVYFFGKDGFQESVEAMGTWTAYASKDEVMPPRISSISVLDVVKAFSWLDGRSPKEIMKKIQRELDAIASSAPR